jgi:hypothetical protein
MRAAVRWLTQLSDHRGPVVDVSGMGRPAVETWTVPELRMYAPAWGKYRQKRRKQGT